MILCSIRQPVTWNLLAMQVCVLTRVAGRLMITIVAEPRFMITIVAGIQVDDRIASVWHIYIYII